VKAWFGGPFWRSPIVPWLLLFVLPILIAMVATLLVLGC